MKNKITSTMDTTTKKREKRLYVKKRLLTQDELWKIIIPNLWVPFIHFCLEDWAQSIDTTRKPVFLDKELRRLVPRGKAKNRAVDILMRVYLKDGTIKFFLFHIEVQGYYDAHLEQRVFQYYYRITDFFQEPIETLVVLIDDDPDYRPSEYVQVFGQTSLNFKFRMFKLLDNPPPYINKEDNPFSIVFEVAWYALKQNMLKNDDDIKALKFRLIKRLLENETDRKTIYDLFDFINIYLPFQSPKKSVTFERELYSLIEKEENMGTTTIREYLWQKIEAQEEKKLLKLEKRFKEEARLRQEEARLHQEEAKQKLTTTVLRLHNHGSSVETIAHVLDESIASVEAIINTYLSSLK